MEPDVLYAVRPGERNESLRLSLRSLSYIPHRRVIIAGYCPSWVRNVTVVPVRRRANKFDSIEENVRHALESDDLTPVVVYMNDDFYFTRPVESVPLTHGGRIDQYQGRQELKIRMRRTLTALRAELPDSRPLYSYDGVHTPLPVDVDLGRELLSTIPRGALWRTWYGNMSGGHGVQVPDAKARGPLEGELPTLLSTGPKSWHALRQRLDDELPAVSPYVG